MGGTQKGKGRMMQRGEGEKPAVDVQLLNTDKRYFGDYQSRKLSRIQVYHNNDMIRLICLKNFNI